MFKKSLGIILTLCILLTSCLTGMSFVASADETVNNALYIDTTGCSNYTVITLDKAVYGQPVGTYTVEFSYYTVENGGNSRLNFRTSGNSGQYAADLYSTSFAKDEWLTYSSTVNNSNTALQIQLYVWPGFKGYIDNIVLTDSNGNVSMKLDFDRDTANVASIGNDANAIANIA